VTARGAVATLLFAGALSAQDVLSGQVVDMRHEPLPVARVWVDREDDPGVVLARTVADGQGRFRIALQRGDDVVRVWAASDDRSTNFVRCTPSTQTAVVRLPECATLTGTLRDADGRPAEGAAVRSTPKGDLLAGAVATVTTDADGRFELRGVPLAHHDVFALIPDVGLAYAAVHVTGDDEITLAHVAPATSLSLTVQGLDAAQQQRTIVELRTVNGGGLTLPPPLDAPHLRDGRWHTDVLPDWRFTLRLRAPGVRFEPAVVTIEKGVEPKHAEFVADVVEPLELHGTVFDAQQQPVAAVPLLVRGEHGDSVRVVSDEHGRFATMAPFARDESILVRTERGELVGDNRGLRALPGADPRGLALQRFTASPERPLQVFVAAACRATGRLLTHAGRPAPFVRVALQTTHGRWKSVWADVTVTSTDAAGRFTLRGVAHSDRKLRLFVDDPLGLRIGEPFELREPGATAELGDMKLAQTVTIEGVARDENGELAIGAQLSVSWQRDDLPSGTQRTVTDSRGRFRFVGVAPGPFQVLHGERDDHQFIADAGGLFEIELQLR